MTSTWPWRSHIFLSSWKMWVWQFEAAIMKHCKLGGLHTTETYFLQSWRLEVWDQGASMVSGEAHFIFCRGCLPTAFSYGGGERVMPSLNLCFHQREFYFVPWVIGDFSWIHWSSVPKWISASSTLSLVKLLISSVMCCKLTWYNVLKMPLFLSDLPPPNP